MRLTSTSLTDGADIHPRYAFGDIDPQNHVALAANINPALAWSELPEGTQSLVLICVDVDVPTRADDVNQEGRVVPSDLPRTDFYHWLLVDVPPSVRGIGEGECAQGVVARGKRAPAGPAGSRQGVNDYSSWFAGDADMQGEYFGYDGPCPPWNDSIVHHYHFRLFALDVARLEVEGAFTGADVMAAMRGHVLAEAGMVGRYTLTPALRNA